MFFVKSMAKRENSHPSEICHPTFASFLSMNFSEQDFGLFGMAF